MKIRLPLLTTLHQQPVRDLYWLTQAPSLLQGPLPNAIELFNVPNKRFDADYFTALDQNPSRLTKHLENHNSQRIGKYFENLLSFLLLESGQYQKVLQSLQIKRQDQKTTLGELDFVLQPQQTEQAAIHLEVSIKFYLGTSQLSEQQHWIGPNCQDRLDLKFNHLMQKQCLLSQTTNAQAFLQTQIQATKLQPCVFMTGFLFYPLSQPTLTHIKPTYVNPNHLSGFYLSIDQLLNTNALQTLEQQQNNSQPGWILLKKPYWLAPPCLENIAKNKDAVLYTDITALHQAISTGFESYPGPVMVQSFNLKQQTPSTRLVITPKVWPF